MSAADEKSFFPSTKTTSSEMTDLGSNGEQAKKKPKYYEGVYMNERTISTNGDVTPALLRSPISRGLFHLPRYVPKYTINSRLHGNYADETFSDSKSSRTFDRKYKDSQDDDSYFREVPIYRDRLDGVETTSSGSETKETKKKSKGRTKENAETEQRKSKCCSKCCSVECCTPKCRRCACIFVVVALVVAAALLAVALGLYFGYFMQFGDSYPMKANITVTNAAFPAYLSNLSNPNTVNLTNSICHAFERTLENVSQIVVRLSSCSAISYTNGSINAIFNLNVSHRRDQFTNSGDAFSNAIINRVKTEFHPNASGYFADAVSNSVLSGGKTSGGTHFNVVLNDISSGHFSPPTAPSIPTVRPTISSIAVKTSKPSPTPTAAKVSSITNLPSSTRNQSSMTWTIKPLSSTVTWPSSTQGPTAPPTSSIPQNPTAPPTSSRPQNPTAPPTSSRHRTTTVPVPASTSTQHFDVTTVVASSPASTSGPRTKQVTTNNYSGRSTSPSASRATTASSSR